MRSPRCTTRGATCSRDPPAPIRRRRDPAAWNTFDYGIQRNTTGGAIEVSARSPFFFRADYNEVQTTGTRPGSGQLGTGSGNGLIEFGIPTEYKTKNALFEGGYTARTWNVKLAYLDSKFSNSIDTMQWTNFYMRSALDTSLLPPDNELKKWSVHATARELPLDSTFLLRASQSKLTNSVDLGDGSVATPWNSGLKPTSKRSTVPGTSNLQPNGVGYLITAPSLVDVRRRGEDDVGTGVDQLHPDEGARQPGLLQLLRQGE